MLIVMEIMDIIFGARKIYCTVRNVDLLDVPGAIREWYLSKENKKFTTDEDF